MVNPKCIHKPKWCYTTVNIYISKIKSSTYPRHYTGATIMYREREKIQCLLYLYVCVCVCACV